MYLDPRGAAAPLYDGYPLATVSVFRAKSNDRQQYQLATEAYGRHGAAMARLLAVLES